MNIIKALKTAKDNKKLIAQNILFDFCFLFTLAIINIILSKTIPNPESFIMSTNSRILTIVLIIMIYLALTIISYSFFKSLTLRRTVRMLKEKETDKTFLDFLRLNTKLIVLFFAIFLIGSALFIMTIRIEALIIVRNGFYGLFGIFTFTTFHIAHSTFMQDKSKKTLIKTFDIIFTRPVMILRAVATILISSCVIIGAYYVFDWVVLKILGAAIGEPKIFIGYAIITTVLFALIISVFISMIRLYFFITLKSQKRKPL